MTERLCVYSITLNEDWNYDVTCFCGWSAETAFDEREGALTEWQRHQAATSSRVASRAADAPKSVHLGAESD